MAETSATGIRWGCRSTPYEQYITAQSAALCATAEGGVSGAASALGPFWALSTSVMSSSAAAGAIAYVNAVGNLGGFAGPSLLGHVKDRTGSFTPGLCLLAASLVTTGLLALCVRHQPAPQRDARPVKANGPRPGAESTP